MEELKKFPMTALLLFVNVMAFLLVEITGGSMDTYHMIECGAAYTPLIVEQGEVYRIFTSMFLHFGMAHLANNMLLLFVMGQRLEPILGRGRFLLVYLLGGICGNVLSLFLDIQKNSFTVSAGASGAVFALIGAMIYVLLRHKGRVGELTVQQIIFMAVLSLYFGFTSSGVDNAAHVGGLAGGFAAAVLAYHPRRIRKEVP